MPRLIARSLPERIRLYERAVDLQNDGLSYSQIAKEIGVSRSSVYDWLGRHNPPKREAYMPNLSYSADLAYLIGFYLGDGRSAGVEKHVRFSLADLQQARLINEVMARILRTTTKDLILEHGYFSVRFTNAILYDFLHQPLQALRNWIDPYKTDFLRGLYDAEGYVSPGINSVTMKLNSVSVGVANTDLALLELARELLTGIGIKGFMRRTNRAGGVMVIHGKSYTRKKDVFHYVITGTEQASRFAKMIGFGSIVKNLKLVDLVTIFQQQRKAGARYVRFTSTYTKIGSRWKRTVEL